MNPAGPMEAPPASARTATESTPQTVSDADALVLGRDRIGTVVVCPAPHDPRQIMPNLRDATRQMDAEPMPATRPYARAVRCTGRRRVFRKRRNDRARRHRR